MKDRFELHRVRSGVAGPEGLVVSAAINRGDEVFECEVWVIPLNRHLAFARHQIATRGLAPDAALEMVRREFVRHLDHEFAKRFSSDHPGLEWPKPLSLSDEPSQSLVRLWLSHPEGERLQQIQQGTGSETLREHLRTITRLPKPTIERF